MSTQSWGRGGGFKSLILTFSKVVTQKLEQSSSAGQRKERGPFLHVHQHQRGRGGCAIIVYHCVTQLKLFTLDKLLSVCLSECVCY